MRLDELVSNFPNLATQWDRIKSDLDYNFQGVMVSLSGGPDSTALFRAFCEFTKSKKKIPLAAFHVNYGLRGADSEGDETFCKELCRTHGVPLHIYRVKNEERPNTGSIQDWARKLRKSRHDVFVGEGWIVATGHQREDLAETIIFRMIRGFSVTNMAGLSLWNGTYWRPFLDTPKETLLAYLHAQKQPYRHDRSNDEVDYTRNLIRHQILPVLTAINSGAIQNINTVGTEAQALGHEFLKALERRKDPLASTKLREMELPAAQYLVKAHILHLLKNRDIRLSKTLVERATEHLLSASTKSLTLDINEETALTIELGSLSITKRKTGLKNKRYLQYQQQIHSSEASALVGAGSYVFLRDKTAVCSAGPTAKSKGHSLEFEVKNAKSNAKIKFAGKRVSKSVKNLFQELSIPLMSRSRFRLLYKNGEPFALFDGENFINPANLARQATAEGINFIISKKV